MHLKRSISPLLILTILLSLILSTVPSIAQDESGSTSHLINHRGQDLFLSGINLAWVSFARDLSDFNELEFIRALDELAAAHGNTLRWWLHTDGSTSPLYGEDGKVTGLGENDIEVVKRALDLAYERGILVLLTLWSHDMMNEREGVPAEANQQLIEDPEYTQAYIDNALIPLVTGLKGHPAIAAWEIFNEPEGVTSAYGWTDLRTQMPSIQQFVNLLAGAIHRADPDTKVTNGSWNMQVLTDVGGMTNYYRDDRLIEAGGDADGTLDFYEVHYYPEYFDETTSPFHNPYAHWELDKPLIIGEFPAAGIADLGTGFQPRRPFQNIVRALQYIYENGYAGALGWTWNGGNQYGGLPDLAAGLHWIYRNDTEHVAVNIGDIDHLPRIIAPIENLVLSNDVTSADVINLNDVFFDEEDGNQLTYEITQNSAPDKVQAVIQETGDLTLTFSEDALGAATLEITATDSAGNYSRDTFVVQVTDPDLGNVALGKLTVSSSIENNSYLAEFATDGLENTRWSTQYEDNQWLIVDLDGVFTVSGILLRWETAFGQSYEIQVWDGTSWQTVFSEENSDGQLDEAIFETPFPARYLRFNGLLRGTQWGFSLWEFQVFGSRAEDQDLPLAQTPPPDLLLPTETVEEAAPVADESATLYSFESDVQGWALADYWAGGIALDYSDAMASEGSGALQLSLLTSGTQWEEGGAFITLPDGTDWSDATALTMDVYVPAEATSFLSQIFIKTGPDWTWANTADIALTPGEWTTLTADLSTLGDMSQVHEFGVKLGSSATAFEGVALIDNVRLVSGGEPASEEANTAEGKATALYSFEGDVQGWALADYWAGGIALDLSDAMATDGSDALQLSLSTSGTQWEEGGAFITLPDGTDWSDATALTIDVYVPAEASSFLSQIFVKTGPDWTWANTADIALTPGEWTTLRADLSTLGDMSQVHEFGVKLGSSATAFEGVALIDNVRLIQAAE